MDNQRETPKFDIKVIEFAVAFVFEMAALLSSEWECGIRTVMLKMGLGRNTVNLKQIFLLILILKYNSYIITSLPQIAVIHDFTYCHNGFYILS